MRRSYPDADRRFPRPPRTVTDDEGRQIRMTEVGPDAADELVAMYEGFAPADRAQGVPPVGERAIRRWLEDVLAEACYDVVARHDGAPVGHAMLVPDPGEGFELAIFVRQSHQGAGVGTALLETLLGLAQADGVARVWLTVERWNDPAMALYRSVGFEPEDTGGLECEMSLGL